MSQAASSKKVLSFYLCVAIAILQEEELCLPSIWRGFYSRNGKNSGAFSCVCSQNHRTAVSQRSGSKQILQSIARSSLSVFGRENQRGIQPGPSHAATQSQLWEVLPSWEVLPPAVILAELQSWVLRFLLSFSQSQGEEFGKFLQTEMTCSCNQVVSTLVIHWWALLLCAALHCACLGCLFLPTDVSVQEVKAPGSCWDTQCAGTRHDHIVHTAHQATTGLLKAGTHSNKGPTSTE
ncbi:interleukin-22 receptor subunit alpha-2 isoform X4 [Centrocercus urophasianus]|uniref:interleukin-22 receptor subunit alpha-2 isoform X4 n=1 Tax=Centrocercus urophasianus TaxID=9002 RepID=UPI001C64DB31|nr:interleukin-22 receptor subunit alpha-2 isoform X4 [Centrocercus urophasianus]